jgi:hypothetical protein
MRGLPFAFIILAAGLASAAAAADDKLGARTASPGQMLAELGEAMPDAELEQAVAAAAAHPLGSVDNPVRVGGPEGERAYIARLRCANGTRPRVGPRADGGVGAFGTVVDLYALDCGAAAPGRFGLVMDMYHEEHREEHAPPGFGIDPL